MFLIVNILEKNFGNNSGTTWENLIIWNRNNKEGYRLYIRKLKYAIFENVKI